jgi:6-phosphofructokinase 1
LHSVQGTAVDEDCESALSFEKAGPREQIYFEPARTTAGIVTCGGLCPGTNDVIRALVMQLHHHYGVARIHGFRYGYAGLTPQAGSDVLELTPDLVKDIHHKGGSILGSSRGAKETAEMVDTLERMGIDMLFTIGGDGTLRGTQDIHLEIQQRGLKIAVIGVPKTIDNDIPLVEKTFGFRTAVSIAVQSIRAAHVEATGAPNGIGLVRLMGRHSGYIAATATLAEPDVNCVLIPEIPFRLDGEHGVVAYLKRRLERRGHAVVVAAEGAGQELMSAAAAGHDASGNRRLGDIGLFLKQEFGRMLNEQGIPHNLKYIDPSYLVRSAPASAMDSLFCANLGHHAVHAAMSGRTGMLVGSWHNFFTHVPVREAVAKRKVIAPEGELLRSVLESTGQPRAWS